MTAESGRLHEVLRRDRAFLLVGLAAVVLIAWIYLFLAARGMEGAAGAGGGSFFDLLMPRAQGWSGVDLLLVFAMWAVMMVAMMVPSLAPFVLVFARLRRAERDMGAAGSVGFLLLGYLLVWVGFSVLATLVQWALHEAALLSPEMVNQSPLFGGALLIAAGSFQLTPLKRACLVRCRSPVSFLMTEWRSGRWGGLVMGSKHGVYCVGCCWMLMALLFVGGVMNVLWIATIAAFVLVERIAPGGGFIGRAASVALIVAGLALVTAGAG